MASQMCITFLLFWIGIAGISASGNTYLLLFKNDYSDMYRLTSSLMLHLFFPLSFIVITIFAIGKEYYSFRKTYWKFDAWLNILLMLLYMTFVIIRELILLKNRNHFELLSKENVPEEQLNNIENLFSAAISPYFFLAINAYNSVFIISIMCILIFGILWLLSFIIICINNAFLKKRTEQNENITEKIKRPMSLQKKYRIIIKIDLISFLISNLNLLISVIMFFWSIFLMIKFDFNDTNTVNDPAKIFGYLAKLSVYIINLINFVAIFTLTILYWYNIKFAKEILSIMIIFSAFNNIFIVFPLIIQLICYWLIQNRTLTIKSIAQTIITKKQIKIKKH